MEEKEKVEEKIDEIVAAYTVNQYTAQEQEFKVPFTVDVISRVSKRYINTCVHRLFSFLFERTKKSIKANCNGFFPNSLKQIVVVVLMESFFLMEKLDSCIISNII